MRKNSRLFKWILLCTCILLIVYGSIRLIIYITDMGQARQTSRDLREAAENAAQTVMLSPSPTQESENNSQEAAGNSIPIKTETAENPTGLPVVEYPNGYTLVPKIQELRKKSEYIIGWITMDDLDEPVVHRDNSFFLDHDAMGNKNSNGAIFMDQGTNLLTRPYTILLYGHNMKTGIMFGNLRKYEEFSYCFKHRMLSFDTLYEEGRYEIFAVSTISLVPGKAKYVSLTDLQSSDRKTRKEALNALVIASAHGKMTEVNEEDQILLLITCVGNDDERLIVAARRTA